jgi:uncharacterized protein (DUF924 family)
VTPDAVLNYWFEELQPQDWFKQNDTVDRAITDRFIATYLKAATGDLYTWRATITGRLAEVIVLDQFPRNLYRGDAQSFATDAMALILTQEALLQDDLEVLTPTQKAFLLMPLMHSESLAIHEQALRWFDAPGLESNLEFEKQHKIIIDQFGRYPHRNAILGRTSTQEEHTFLAQGGATF